MAVTPNSLITPQMPLTSSALCTAANTNYVAPNQTQLLVAAQANGARITKVHAHTVASMTNTECQLYTSIDGGVTKRLLKSELMATYTVAATTEQPPTDFGYNDNNPLLLGANEALYCAIGVAQTGIVFRAEGASY